MVIDPSNDPKYSFLDEEDYAMGCKKCKTFFRGRRDRKFCKKCTDSIETWWQSLVKQQREEWKRHIEKLQKN